jgi:glycosyltransferase involved in cell wall biosynthesis
MIQADGGPQAAAVAAHPPAAATESVLGLFYEGAREAREGEVIFGARVATQSFTEALLQHGRMDRCELFAPSDSVGAAAAQVSLRLAAGRTAGAAVRVHSYRQLVERFESYRFTAWHEPAAMFPRVYHLRGAYARTLFPITFTHHTVSNPFLLHSMFLSLLLADSHPCDAVVCTSRASRAAVTNLLAHVAEEFGRAFGTTRQFRGRLELIPLGVDTQLFRPATRWICATSSGCRETR